MPGVFFAAPILTPILPSPPSRSRLSTPARFAPALVISRYDCDSPRAKTPGGNASRRRYRPPRGSPTCHLSCDKTRADGVRAEDIPRIRFSAAAVRGRRALSRGRRGSTTRGTDAIRRSLRVFVSRSPPDARAAPRVARPSGAPSPETSESSVLAPDRRKKTRVVI